MTDDIFYEAEYKLQNCLRITLRPDQDPIVEVEYLDNQYMPVAKYVTELIKSKEH